MPTYNPIRVNLTLDCGHIAGRRRYILVKPAPGMREYCPRCRRNRRIVLVQIIEEDKT